MERVSARATVGTVVPVARCSYYWCTSGKQPAGRLLPVSHTSQTLFPADKFPSHATTELIPPHPTTTSFTGFAKSHGLLRTRALFHNTHARTLARQGLHTFHGVTSADRVLAGLARRRLHTTGTFR